MLFTHDQAKKYNSVGDIEKDLTGFKYKGPGWYLNDTDSLLVQEFPCEKINALGTVGKFYYVICWNTPDGRELFCNEYQRLINMPIVHKE